MRRISMLVMPAVLLAAAETTSPMSGPRGPETSQGQSGVHMNRHVDAHVPARGADVTTKGAEEPVRRRPAQDPLRGVIQPQAPSPPPPLRDRRY